MTYTITTTSTVEPLSVAEVKAAPRLPINWPEKLISIV